jgi:Fe-S cluster assembly iron-binding protein IscA
MLEVTEKALDALTTVLDSSETEPQEGLRLAPNPGGGFGLVVDEPHEGDRVITQGERPVLLVEQEVSEVLGDVVLDLIDSPEGPQLTLRTHEGA